MACFKKPENRKTLIDQEIMTNTGCRLLYAGEHLQCSCYNHEGPDSQVEVLEIPNGGICRRELKEPEMAFIYRGRIRMSFGEGREENIARGKFALFPPGIHISAQAAADTSIFIVRLLREIDLCEQFHLAEAPPQTHRRDPFHTVTMNEPVKKYLESFIPRVKEGLRCRHYLDRKTDELMFLIRAYYPRKEVATLFAPLLGPDFTFRNFVYKNALKCCSIRELAAAANMSVNGFIKRFKLVMGCTPSEFINRLKADAIRNKLLCSSEPLKVISDQYGFATAAGFALFCRNNLGDSPSRIRSKKGTASDKRVKCETV